jgi:hypothetical protein
MATRGFDVQGNKQRRASARSGVHRDNGDACFRCTCLEEALEVPRVNRGAVLGGEDQPGSHPNLAHRQPRPRFDDFALSQSPYADVRKR